MKIVGIIVVIFFLAGCISTQVKDFTDPEYQTFTSKKMLVGTTSLEFDDYFISEAQEYNLDVILVPMYKVFLPTRQYTIEQKLELLKKNKFDSYLIVNLIGDSGKKSRVSGYSTQSNATAYSSGNFATARGSSTTTAIVSHSRATQSKASLFDSETQNTMWTADLNTSAKGALYTGSNDAMKDISASVIKSLIKAGHLKVKQSIKTEQQ